MNDIIKPNMFQMSDLMRMARNGSPEAAAMVSAQQQQAARSAALMLSPAGQPPPVINQRTMDPAANTDAADGVQARPTLNGVFGVVTKNCLIAEWNGPVRYPFGRSYLEAVAAALTAGDSLRESVVSGSGAGTGAPVAVNATIAATAAYAAWAARVLVAFGSTTPPAQFPLAVNWVDANGTARTLTCRVTPSTAGDASIIYMPLGLLNANGLPALAAARIFGATHQTGIAVGPLAVTEATSGGAAFANAGVLFTSPAGSNIEVEFIGPGNPREKAFLDACESGKIIE